MSEHDDLCKAMSQGGWLSHPLACLNRTYGPGQSLVRALRSTRTCQAFAAGQKPPPFNERAAIPATLTYTRRRGRRGPKYLQPDRVLIDRSSGLLMHIHSENGHRTIAFLDDIDPASISENDNIAESHAYARFAREAFPESSHAQSTTLTFEPAGDLPLDEMPVRLRQTVSRLVRDTKVVRDIKALYERMCQLCGDRFELKPGEFYAEVHHLKPLGMPHRGDDRKENVICVCPSCHVRLDFGAVRIEPTKLKSQKHEIAPEFIEYHNNRCF